MSNYHPQSHSCSYKAITISSHAKQRAFERMSITTETELKKKAHTAKLNGINITTLSPENTQGLSLNMVRYLKNHYAVHTNSERAYYYNDYVYIFAGKRSRTLITLVPCTEQDMKEALIKLDRRKPTYGKT